MKSHFSSLTMEGMFSKGTTRIKVANKLCYLNISLQSINQSTMQSCAESGHVLIKNLTSWTFRTYKKSYFNFVT